MIILKHLADDEEEEEDEDAEVDEESDTNDDDDITDMIDDRDSPDDVSDIFKIPFLQSGNLRFNPDPEGWSLLCQNKLCQFVSEAAEPK